MAPKAGLTWFQWAEDARKDRAMSHGDFIATEVPNDVSAEVAPRRCRT